jgi:histidine triad (HIT) family protein
VSDANAFRFRSEGPAVSSPSVRAGLLRCRFFVSAEGAARLGRPLRASGLTDLSFPALTDGATNCRSFGPKNKMSDDFYCDQVLSGRTAVNRVTETANVLAYHHTRPFWPVHIVVIPKRHIDSLLAIEETDATLLLELMQVIREVAREVIGEHGACRVLTNLGSYQDSKHLHWHVSAGEPLDKPRGLEVVSQASSR